MGIPIHGKKNLEKKLNSEVKLNKQKHKYNLPNITTIQKVLKSRSQKKKILETITVMQFKIT